MSSVLSGLDAVTNNFLLGYAIGRAAGPALEPVVQDLANEAWSLHAVKPPAAGTLALGVAQGQVDPAQAATWAKETGFDSAQFDALVSIANTGPALGLAYSAWRRGQLTDAQFTTALKRTGLEEQWNAALLSLKENPLDPAEIAKAIHRGIMRADGLLIAVPPSTPGKVEQVPPSDLDPITESSWSGIDAERLRIMVGNAGLPPGIVQMLQLLNRGEITVDDFRRGVGESNLRNEWADAMLNLRRRLLTPHEYEEAALRGIITQAEADAGAALSGMEKPDAELLFQIMGRPLTVHQLTTGLARGGLFGGTYDDVPEPYRDAIRRSNIRPEYARLAYANRYTFPSAFVLRSLAQAGELGDAQAVEQILLEIGWPPSLAAKVAPSWVGGGGGADSNVAKAQTHLWTTVHSSYKAEEITQAEAAPALNLLGIAPASQAEIFALWDAERALIRRQLSATQVRKALGLGVINPATGVAWTLADATARLLELGYDQADAETFLAS